MSLLPCALVFASTILVVVETVNVAIPNIVLSLLMWQ
jgi:hypothetical protein